MKFLNIENVFEVLALTGFCQADVLKKFAIDLIVENFHKFNSTHFSKLASKHPEVVIEIMSKLALKMTPK